MQVHAFCNAFLRIRVDFDLELTLCVVKPGKDWLHMAEPTSKDLMDAVNCASAPTAGVLWSNLIWWEKSGFCLWSWFLGDWGAFELLNAHFQFERPHNKTKIVVLVQGSTDQKRFFLGLHDALSCKYFLTTIALCSSPSLHPQQQSSTTQCQCCSHQMLRRAAHSQPRGPHMKLAAAAAAPRIQRHLQHPHSASSHSRGHPACPRTPASSQRLWATIRVGGASFLE